MFCACHGFIRDTEDCFLYQLLKIDLCDGGNKTRIMIHREKSQMKKQLNIIIVIIILILKLKWQQFL